MSYNKTNWQNLPSTDTPIIANSLNNMENGIADANGAIAVNTYSNTSTYAIGDYCMYNNKLYRCKTAIATAENFNSTNWQEIKIMEEMANTGVTVSSTEPTGNNKNKVWFKKGKNLFDKIEVGTLDSTGEISVSNARLRSANFSPVNPSTSYTIKVFSYNTSKGTPKVYIFYYSQNRGYISTSGLWQDNNYTFTTPSNCYFVKVLFYLSNSTSQTLTTSDITQVELEQGSTATTYEEYVEPAIYTKNDNNVYEKFEMSQNEIYSTEEIKIGTWIDGKPLYRQVIQTTTPTVSTNGTAEWKQVIIPNVSFGMVTTCQMYYVGTYGPMIVPIIRNILTSGINQYIGVSVAINQTTNTGIFQIESTSTTFNNRTVYAIMEYTKTTD